MRVRITRSGSAGGDLTVAGDKSVAHRWLMLAATARGTSRLVSVPPSLDVRSTASCLSAVAPHTRPALEAWSRNAGSVVEGRRSTWNATAEPHPGTPLEVEGEGRRGLTAARRDLDCGNSGTTMRLLSGVLASVPVRSVLTGDDSLARRPMERVAAPLRSMGARVETVEGHAPVTIVGGDLHGIDYEPSVASAQLKGAVLLAAAGADGPTTVREPAATRDHTERALAALGAPIRLGERTVQLAHAHEHEGFAGTVPGDPSNAAFLVAAAALTGAEVTIRDVGLNPTRIHYLEVMRRMGIRTETRVERVEVGEPVGDLSVDSGASITAIRVEEQELPLVIDEVPVLALLAAHAERDTWFLGAGELRLKESDRLAAIARGVRGLGGHAADEGDDLVVAGGGLDGGVADAGGDHRMAMALGVGALGARAACVIEGMEWADVSFPGFLEALAAVGARVEVI